MSAQFLRLVYSGVVVGVLIGCTPTSDTQIRSQATHDFQCPSSQVTVEHVGPTTIEVRGCGKSALYVCDEGANPQVHDDHTQVIPEEEARYQGGGASCHLAQH